MPFTPQFVIRTFNYRLLPTKRQHETLDKLLDDQRILYNAGLEERIGAYRTTGKGRSFVDQSKAVTEWRKADEGARSCPVNLQRWTLRRLDDAFNAFVHRAKSKQEKAGFPRFRSATRWKSFGFAEFSGIQLIDNRLVFKSMASGLRVHFHRSLPKDPDIRSCTFTKGIKGWRVGFQVKLPVQPLEPTGKEVGIDLGISTLAALSDGVNVVNKRPAEKQQAELRRRQRALARCRKGSKRRKKVKKMVTRCHEKIKNTRTTYLHQVSAQLVGDYDLIAVEKLNVKGLAKGILSKQVHDASWGRLLGFIRYKAEGAGKRVIEVDPRYTSQICPGCGVIKAKKLSERIHRCDGCGLVLDRDTAAARVILGRAVVGPGVVNVGSLIPCVDSEISGLRGISN